LAGGKMAGADYYSCDKCGCKTFYDADLSYTLTNNKWENPNPRDEWNAMPDGNVGDMMIICKDCAKKYKIVMRAKNSK
jgi:hypothetical protein